MADGLSESEQAAVAADDWPGPGRGVASGKGRDPVEVPASVVQVLAEALDHAQRGEQVRVIADDEEIITQQAADLLNVSRPYLVGLVIEARSVAQGRGPSPSEAGRCAALPGGHLTRDDGMRPSRRWRPS